MKKFTPVFLLTTLLLSGCENFIRMPLKISACCPASRSVCNPENLEIYIVFNKEPEKLQTSDAFSISTDGREPPGRLIWEGARLTFSPYQSLQPNAEYLIKVSTAAEDILGNSLTEEFQRTFRTGEAGVKPGIKSVIPEPFTKISNQLTQVIVVFDQPMDKASVFDGFTISPSVSGVSAYDSDGYKFTFTPAEKLKWQEDYSLKISEKTLSAAGLTLGEDYNWNFRMGTDRTAPELISATSKDGSVVLTPSPAENPAMIKNGGWEKQNSIRLIFSEEVERQSAEASVNIEPSVAFNTSWDEAATPSEMLIRWEDGLEWKKLYRLNIASSLKDRQGNSLEEEAVYHIFVDGPRSKPPVLELVDFIPDQATAVRLFDREVPANSTGSHRILNTSGGDASQGLFYLDYYFTLADGAQLPFFGFIENYNIAPGGGCLSITYLDFQIFNPGESLAPAAAPKPAPSSSQAIVRLICSVTDSKTASGTIIFQVYKDLVDSLGNRMELDWRVELFDEDN